MSRHVLILANDAIRLRATNWIAKVPVGTRVEFKEPKRTLPQNDRFWAMASDVSSQLTWHGVKLTPDDWKLIFLDALKREVRIVPNLDGNGFVNLGRSSSDLSVAEMTDLMTIIEEFGANHGVIFHDQESLQTSAPISEPATTLAPGAPKSGASNQLERT